MTGPSTGTARLRQLLKAPEFIIMPCCFDGISAKLIQQCDYSLTFMSGFAVSAARLGLPDTGLISYAEMLDQGRNICSAVDIPVIGDGDTGAKVHDPVLGKSEQRNDRNDDDTDNDFAFSTVPLFFRDIGC